MEMQRPFSYISPSASFFPKNAQLSTGPPPAFLVPTEHSLGGGVGSHTGLPCAVLESHPVSALVTY